MSGRTPSFIVVGLVIIMFLLGLFYMSCSSKNTELRLSLEQFEERIRSLTMKNSDADKKIENLHAHKRELDDEKLTLQRQIEKKNSEVNELNKKLNEKSADVQSLKSDKQVLDQQLTEYKSQSEVIASKNVLIEKLQKQLNEQKQFALSEQSRLKQEIDTLKAGPSQNNLPPPANEQQNAFQIPNQRFKPLISDYRTTRTIASYFQTRTDKISNITNEIQANIIRARPDDKDRVLNVVGANTNASNNVPADQQRDLNNKQDQNVPAPPLANNAQRQQLPNHVESAQAAPQADRGLAQDVLANHAHQRQQRALNNPQPDNKNIQLPNDENDDENDDDDEEQLDNNIQQNLRSSSSTVANENRVLVNNPLVRERVPLRSNNENNHRSGIREQFQRRNNNFRQQRQLENGEEVAEDNHERGQQQPVRKRNVL